MEPRDQILDSEKSVSEKEGVGMQIMFSDTLSSEQNVPCSVSEHLEEIKSTPDEITCTPKNNDGKDSLQAESSNFVEESKSEAAQEESKNVSVEKIESSCMSTESSNISMCKEKSGTVPDKVEDVSHDKDISQSISTRSMTDGQTIETSNELSFTTLSPHDEALSHTNGLASSDNTTQESNDGGNSLTCTGKIIQTSSSGSKREVSQMGSLRMEQKEAECENVNMEKETNSDGELISSDKQETSKFSEITDDQSSKIKNSADVVETTAFKSTNNHGTADSTEVTSEEKFRMDQSRIATNTFCVRNDNSEATIKNAGDKHSVDTPESVGENITKDSFNTAASIETLHEKKGENVTNKHLCTAKTATQTVKNDSGDEGISEARPQTQETEEDRERRAYFYISSSSVPGMGKEWEWPSISSDSHHQRPPRRMERRRNTSESPNCLGTQRCHYIILAVGVLGAILGCLTYHLQDYGIGPKVLRPIGASAAFLSFVVCAFSSVYLTYLSYYPQRNPVSNMLIETVPQGYNSDPRFYFTSTAAATAQQVFRETQSADALDRRGYSWHLQTEIKRPFDEPGPSGYDPDSKRFKMDPTTGGREAYEMRSLSGTSGKDQCKERSFSQASEDSLYTLANQVYHSNSRKEDENNEKTPLLPKK